MSGFSGLSTAASGLYAHQQRIGVIGDNIANIDTPGYAKQRVELGAIGTGNSGVFTGKLLQRGVDVIGITQRRNELLESATRESAGSAAKATVQAESMASIETQLGPLREGSFSDQLNQLFNSFDDLANEPADPATRQVALQRSEQVAGSIRSQADLFDTARGDEIDRVNDAVGQINRLADSIASLNLQIKAGSIGGQVPNSLMGARNEQLAELAQLADIDVNEGFNNDITVSLDGTLLVSESRATHLEVNSVADAELGLLGMERVTVNAPNGRELSIKSGALAGHLTTANVTVPGLVEDLNAFATQFVDDVNAIHSAGYGQDGVTGRPLFSMTGGLASSVTLDVDMVDHPERLAAASTATGTFDGSVAAQLALLGSSETGPAKAYDAFIVKLGSDTNRLGFAAEIAQDAANHAQSSLDSSVGVNLDEELTDLMSAQRAYEASARMVTAIDQMLQTLISSMGLVGR